MTNDRHVAEAAVRSLAEGSFHLFYCNVTVNEVQKY